MVQDSGTQWDTAFRVPVLIKTSPQRVVDSAQRVEIKQGEECKIYRKINIYQLPFREAILNSKKHLGWGEGKRNKFKQTFMSKQFPKIRIKSVDQEAFGYLH